MPDTVAYTRLRRTVRVAGPAVDAQGISPSCQRSCLAVRFWAG